MKTLIISCVALVLLLATDSYAQKASTMRVCGDPSAACTKRAVFKDEDLPFEFTGNNVVSETAPFYVVIVKSVKLAQDADCEKTPADFDRESLQWNFERNKVFIARGCYSIQNNFYTKLGTNVIALAIYAGSTKAQADLFLKKVKSAEFVDAKDAYLLQITTGFNGT